MTNLRKLWTFWWISAHFLKTCLSSWTTVFEIAENSKILNNFLGSYHDIQNLIDCARKCKKQPKCAAASYNDRNLTCNIHFDSIIPPLAMAHSEGTTSLTVQVERIPVELRFDVETLNTEFNVSADKATLSYGISSKGIRWPPGRNLLQKYKGPATDHCIDKGQRFYYDFYFQFEMRKRMMDYRVEMEFCIADKTTIGNAPYCGESSVDGWTFIITRYQTYMYICSIREIRYDITPLSEYIPEATISGTFAIFVDRVENTISIFDKDAQSLIYSFTGVITNAKLCPAFQISQLNSNNFITILSAYKINQ